jgi:hypothetical protein
VSPNEALRSQLSPCLLRTSSCKPAPIQRLWVVIGHRGVRRQSAKATMPQGPMTKQMADADYQEASEEANLHNKILVVEAAMPRAGFACYCGQIHSLNTCSRVYCEVALRYTAFVDNGVGPRGTLPAQHTVTEGTECEFCGAMFFSHETLICCSHGEIRISQPSVRTPSTPITTTVFQCYFNGATRYRRSCQV